MMKLKAFVKVTMLALVRDFPIMIFSFAVFPILLSTVYGYFQSDMFTPVNTMTKIYVSYQDNDRTNSSKALEQFLKSPGIAEYIEIRKENQDIEIVVPKGYEAGVLENRKTTLKLNYWDEKKSNGVAIVAAILNRYNEQLQEQTNIQKNIGKLDAEKQAVVIRDVVPKLQALSDTSVFKDSLIPQKQALTSYEYYSSSIFSFMFIVMIMSLVMGYYQEKQTGVFNRVISASVSKYQYFNCSLVSWLIFAIVINVIYVSAFRIMGLSFGGSILPLLLIVLAKSLLEAALAGFVVAFFRNKTIAALFMNALMMLSVTVGGAFTPVEKIGSDVIVTISKFLPNTLIINAFKNYLLHDSVAAISAQLIMFVAVAVGVYIISIAKISIKWEA